MDQQRIIFESSPGWIIVCLMAGLGYAYLLYQAKHPWNTTVNRLLFVLRAVLAFLLAFLLLGPIVRQIENFLEKPMFVILMDDSGSIKEGVDSVTLNSLEQELFRLKKSLEEKGYNVKVNNLQGEEIETLNTYQESVTDIQGALRNITNRYEGKRMDGVLLVSDGIYNAGISPLYSSYNFPINTLGVGDTTQRIDVVIRNVTYNKIAYQGNQFPVRVEVLAKGLTNRQLALTLVHDGKVVDRQVKPTAVDGLMIYDFRPLADKKGIQKYDLAVETLPEELNKRNNHASIFIDVVEGKKKIILIASSPHPDIKALRSVLDKNSNYDILTYIPGISGQSSELLNVEKPDLVIFHQVPDQRGRTRELFQRYIKNQIPLFIILGKQTDLGLLTSQSLPLKMEGTPRDYDDVTPVVSPAFNNFIITSETKSVVVDYPPVSVPFGRIQIPLTANSLLFQQVGNVTTDKPLLAVETKNERKIGIMLGEGIWRWRLDEYGQTEHTNGFDELFSKLIQYLSTSEDKRKFRSYPVQQEFSEIEPVVFESQVYNDIFEPVYGNTINIELTDAARKQTRYSYVTNPGNTRYQIGGLNEGVYRYRSWTAIDGKTEETFGQFAVVLKQTELKNLTADFDLLRRISLSTGGDFYNLARLKELTNDLSVKEATGVLHAEEKYDSLINLRWIFWALLSMITLEWFLRKYFGRY